MLHRFAIRSGFELSLLARLASNGFDDKFGVDEAAPELRSGSLTLI